MGGHRNIPDDHKGDAASIPPGSVRWLWFVIASAIVCGMESCALRDPECPTCLTHTVPTLENLMRSRFAYCCSVRFLALFP
jgi:hypothetical protein